MLKGLPRISHFRKEKGSLGIGMNREGDLMNMGRKGNGHEMKLKTENTNIGKQANNCNGELGKQY